MCWQQLLVSLRARAFGQSCAIVRAAGKHIWPPRLIESLVQANVLLWGRLPVWGASHQLYMWLRSPGVGSCLPASTHQQAVSACTLLSGPASLRLHFGGRLIWTSGRCLYISIFNSVNMKKIAAFINDSFIHSLLDEAVIHWVILHGRV